MSRRETQFYVQEAGCLIYVTDRSAVEGTGGTGPITGGELYQDDGFSVRVLEGELSPEEQANWTSKLTAEVNFPTGQMIVAGIMDPDFDRWLAEFGTTDLTQGDGGEHELGCLVSVDPGKYSVEIYGYPPNDLAAGWMEIEEGGPESATEYFERTRPGEEVPEWIREGWEDADFLDFAIRLERTGDADASAPSPEEHYIDWEFRKPEICPVGIRL